jgi:maltooligosyltrehalose trehalohydrolase
MEKDEEGYWKVVLPPTVLPGARYFFRLDSTVTCPDPVSFHQPEGVHGPSELVDRGAFPWEDISWKGLPLSNMIIYELHTGVFSPTHDFEGILHRLDYLLELGINTIELMPLGQFPGERNWGYDGVYPFAIQHSYGGIPGFQRLVNAAHAKGIAVIVDVIYNHFGPEGNYLPEYGPYFTDKYKTPWGSALNFDDADSDGVRNYFFENARMWLEDYHVDGLRLDAVHAICDLSAVHFIQQLKDRVVEIERRTQCKKVLIAEIDLNDPRYIDPPEKGGYGLDGQWVDEFHHALRALLTGETNAYYEDFGEIAHLEKAFRHTYVYDGIYSRHRLRTFGAPVNNNPYSQFVVFAQNHDQVGNRAPGDRLTDNLAPEQLKLAAATVLLSPYVPLLFMGEEYGEKNPFAFFVDFSEPALIEAVRKGRRAEFEGFLLAHAADHDQADLPDPQSPGTFDRSVLSWDYQSATGSALFNFYRQLISLRKTRPALQGTTRDSMIVHPAEGMTLSFERKIITEELLIVLHFGDQKTSLPNRTGTVLNKIFDSAAGSTGNTVPERSEHTTAAAGSDEHNPASGHTAGAGRPILPEGSFELAPYSAVVFAKQL